MARSRRQPLVSPRKTPSQARSKATVESILEAAARILQEAGAEDLTTNRIAEVAGVSIGTLYQYFPNKESIFAALVQRYGSTMRSSVELILPEVESQPLPVAVRRLIEVAVAQRLDQPELAREIEVLDRTLPGPEALLTAGHQLDQRFRRLLEAHRGELAITDIPLAILFCRSAIKGALHDILIARPAVTKEVVTDELTVMVLRYLTGCSA